MYLLEESIKHFSLTCKCEYLQRGSRSLNPQEKKEKKREKSEREEGEMEGGKEEGEYLIPYGNVHSPVITVSCQVQFPHKLCNL